MDYYPKLVSYICFCLPKRLPLRLLQDTMIKRKETRMKGRRTLMPKMAPSCYQTRWISKRNKWAKRTEKSTQPLKKRSWNRNRAERASEEPTETRRDKTQKRRWSSVCGLAHPPRRNPNSKLASLLSEKHLGSYWRVRKYRPPEGQRWWEGLRQWGRVRCRTHRLAEIQLTQKGLRIPSQVGGLSRVSTRLNMRNAMRKMSFAHFSCSTCVSKHERT